MDQFKLLLTIPQVAELLGVSKSTVWREIRRGSLKTVRIGRRLRRVSITELHDYIEVRSWTDYANMGDERW